MANSTSYNPYMDAPFIFYFLQNKESTFWLWKSSTDHVWEKDHFNFGTDFNSGLSYLITSVSYYSGDLTFKGRFVYLVVVEVVVIAVIVLKFGPQLEVVLWWT